MVQHRLNAHHGLSEAGSREDNMSLEAMVRRLRDRVEIEELTYCYCRHADLLDAPAMVALFTDDCVADFMPGNTDLSCHGRSELLGFLASALENTTSGSHHIANVELIFESDDLVTAHMYMYSWQRFGGYPVTADCHRWGRYENQYARTKDGWRFTRLRLVSAGEYGGARFGEQLGRPWPPSFALPPAVAVA
jgi:hypothetical protein